jgi:hypothetical protein
MVEEYGIAQIYDRDAWGEHFLAHWFRRFRLLRRLKVREMPSDQVRKGLPVSRLLDLLRHTAPIMQRCEWRDYSD